MKPLLLPGACALALALMAAAVVHHRLALPERVRQARILAGQAAPQTPAATPAVPAPATAPAKPADHETLELLRKIDGKVDQLARRVETADRAQQDLRDQVAETNRDLMEIQFRVDSHSREFRPLRTVQDSPFHDAPGVLPPRDSSP